MSLFSRHEPEVTEREAFRAACGLGLTSLQGITREGVIQAWRGVMRDNHPDVSRVDHAAAAERIKEAADSRQILLRWLEQQPKEDCQTCGGSGSVRSGLFSSKPCPKCQ